jgi:hypothetical protein
MLNRKILVPLIAILLLLFLTSYIVQQDLHLDEKPAAQDAP